MLEDIIRQELLIHLCAHKKKKKKAILARIISLRSFIVLLLFLEVLRLSGDWKSCAAGRSLSSASAWSPVPSGCCCTRSALGSGAGRGSCQLGQVSEQQVGKAVHRSCSIGEMKKSLQPQQLTSLLYLMIYFLLSSGGLNLQIDHKDARDGHTWVNGAALPADCKLCPKPQSWEQPASWVITNGQPCWDLIGYNASWKLRGYWKSSFICEWPLSR